MGLECRRASLRTRPEGRVYYRSTARPVNGPPDRMPESAAESTSRKRSEKNANSLRSHLDDSCFIGDECLFGSTAGALEKSGADTGDREHGKRWTGRHSHDRHRIPKRQPSGERTECEL